MPRLNIKVLLICNVEELPGEKDTVVPKLLEYVHKPASCTLDVVAIKRTSSEGLAEVIVKEEPDLIINYGLNHGCFWSDSPQLINGTLYPILMNNNSFNELFYTEKVMYSSLFDEIKAKISDIDSFKSMPSKLRIATTIEDLEYITNKCMTEPFGLDTETNFLNPFVKDPAPQVLCYSIAWLSDEEEGWCIPMNQNLIDSGQCKFTMAQSKAYAEKIFFESPQSMYIQNGAYDLLLLYELFDGRQPKNFAGDTMLLLNLYHHANKSCALKENTDIINLPAYKDPIKQWIEEQPKVKGKKMGFADVPLSIIGPYAAMDAIAVCRLINFMKKHLARSLWKFYYMAPHKVLQTANELCWEGYTISRDRFNYTKFILESEIETSYKDARGSIKEHINEEFNIGSPKQLSEILFEKLKLPVFNKTPKGVAATSAKALDDLILFHPFIFKLARVRKLLKLYSSYSIKGYTGVLNTGSRQRKRTGNWTLNAQYNQTNRTARLASRNFNGHTESVKKGGNILTLPAQGSLVKHYFIPSNVAEIENSLYQEILDCLPKDKQEEFKLLESEDKSVIIKPVIPEKVKVEKPKKGI